MRSARFLAITTLATCVLAAPASAQVAHAACRITATVKAANHSPKVNKHYYVTVTASPRTVTYARYQFLFNHQVVSTQYVQNNKKFHFEGHFRDPLLFPAHAAGIGLTLRVVLTNKCGTKKLDWKVKPVK